MKLYVKTLCLRSLVALPLSNVFPQTGLITHPVKKVAKAKPKPVASAPNPTPAPLGTTEGGQHGKVSSLKINTKG